MAGVQAVDVTGLAAIGRYAGLGGPHPAAGLRRQQEAAPRLAWSPGAVRGSHLGGTTR